MGNQIACKYLKSKIPFNISLLSALLVSINISVAQVKEEIKWYNPSAEKSPVLHQQLWNENTVNSFYDRLPAKAERSVRKEVWNLSRNAAGLKLIFNTNAEEIIIRYTTSRPRSGYAMNHFPATGVSGVDLFAENSDNSWLWANGKYDFKDTITYTYTGLSLEKEKYKNGRNFHLYLPLYNGVKWLEIGVPIGSTFKFIPVSTEKTIIVYGTSIAQGGCASRAGMAWTNILNRQLNIPVVNLGFSGNGKLEKEVVDLIVEKEAKIFILDCLPNLGGEIENIKPKTIYAVNAIRAKYPETPIILVDGSHYTEGRMNGARIKGINTINKTGFEAYKELQSGGVKKIFYLKREDIGLDMNDSVDGTHPTDIGMLKYAKAYEKLIKTILK